MAKDRGDRDTQRALAAYANLVRATESVVALLTRQLGPLGLTMSQFRVLEALLHSGPMTQAALCERVVCRDSNMVVVIRNLEKRKLVFRQAHERDRRKKMIHLTPAGEKKIAEVFPVQARLVRAQMGALKNREQEALRRLCGKLGRGDAGSGVVELGKTGGDEGENG